MNKVNINEVEEMVIVVDMVNGFAKGGALADQHIMHIVPAIRYYMENALNNPKQAVAVVKEYHTENAKEFKSFLEHCKRDSWEAELIEELADLEPYCYEFLKNSTSAMFAPGFMDFVKTLISNPKFKKFKIVGCCTDICVMNLAIPLKNLCNELDIDVEIVVLKDAVETFEIKPNVYDEYGRITEEGIHDRREWNEMAFRMMSQAGVVVEDGGYQKKLA